MEARNENIVVRVRSMYCIWNIIYIYRKRILPGVAECKLKNSYSRIVEGIYGRTVRGTWWSYHQRNCFGNVNSNGDNDNVCNGIYKYGNVLFADGRLIWNCF